MVSWGSQGGKSRLRLSLEKDSWLKVCLSLAGLRMIGINWVSLDGYKVGNVIGPSSFLGDWEEKELGRKIHLNSEFSTINNFNVDSLYFWGNPNLWLLGSLPVSAEVISGDSSYQTVLRGLVFSCRNWFGKSTKCLESPPPPHCTAFQIKPKSLEVGT